MTCLLLMIVCAAPSGSRRAAGSADHQQLLGDEGGSERVSHEPGTPLYEP